MLLLRGFAVVLAVALLWPAGLGIAWALLVLVIAAEHPDPRVPDGDPCCGHPDTWGEVAFGIAWGLTLAGVSIALLYGIVTLASFAAKGYWPKLLRLRRLVAALATVA